MKCEKCNHYKICREYKILIEDEFNVNVELSPCEDFQDESNVIKLTDDIIIGVNKNGKWLSINLDKSNLNEAIKAALGCYKGGF